MKLINLFENKVKQAGRNHLIMRLTELDVDGRRYPYKTLFVISDVPRLDDTKYRELYNLSFPAGISQYAKINPLNTYHKDMFGPGKENPQDWTEDEHDDWWMVEVEEQDPPIKTLTWKEFVTQIKTSYPLEAELDDFSE